MSFAHIFRPTADQEVNRVLDHYAIHVPEKYLELEEALDELIERIIDKPILLRKRLRDLRCAFVKGFPYQVWYLWHEDLEVVDIVAFLHARQGRRVLHERL